jgi:hypothetical protein
LADEASPVEEPFEPSSVRATATTPRASSTRESTAGRVGAAVRFPPEAVTLLCAATVAVALGVACGLWVNARLAAASIGPPAPLQLLPNARAAGQKASTASTETESLPADYDGTSSTVDDSAPSSGSGEPAAVAEVLRTTPVETTEEEGAGKRGVIEAAPVGSGTGMAAKTAKSPDEVPDVKKKVAAGQGTDRVVPCALYASANSLTMHGGGAALVLGGAGEAGRVTVTTPDWSNIAVFPEGRTGGNGWVRYSVRSVSKRAGVYRVHFKTPCGSQTILVTVTRP